MAEPQSFDPLFDPFALSRDVVARMEQGLNALAASGMQSDAFAQALNQVLAASMAGQALGQQVSGRTLAVLNLPTRGDIEALSGRLQAVEDRLIGLQATLAQIAGTLPAVSARAMPPRTRKPPAAPRDATRKGRA
ncbi:MAG: hypothetical protein EKK52_05795 [Burkholderiales bacterium]|jgi:hypothetical protein|uniref:hypothetical protein n=1 Tax=Roseateles sp. TaxID=1971397 RepID=UPI000F9A31B5|nr:MAG: hypothetical protein EKK52_05795 [Burkholderiales bacterium]